MLVLPSMPASSDARNASGAGLHTVAQFGHHRASKGSELARALLDVVAGQGDAIHQHFGVNAAVQAAQLGLQARAAASSVKMMLALTAGAAAAPPACTPVFAAGTLKFWPRALELP